MKFDFDILKIISNDIKPATGNVLISEPLLNDQYFSRSVVYLVNSVENSYMGFILNSPSDLQLRDVVEGFEHTDIKLYMGGPVDLDVLFYIHTCPEIIDSDLIADGVYFGGNIEQIRTLTRQNVLNSSNIKFFLGSSGWSPNQLDDEISFNMWLVTKCESDFIFSESKNMWSESLRFVEDRYKIWRNFPIDPELN